MGKLGLFAFGLLVLGGCLSPGPPMEPAGPYTRTIETGKTSAELYKSAVVGVFRIFKRSDATVEFNSEPAGLIVVEGYVAVPASQPGFYDRVWARFIININGSNTRLTVEDVHEVTFGLDGHLVHGPLGLSAEVRPRFEAEMARDLGVFERTLRE